MRARQLSSDSMRRQLARSLRAAVSNVRDRRAAVMGPALPVCREVLPWCEALLGLADWIEGAGPVNACLMARTLLLLSDGSGPLYNPTPRCSMGEMLWWIADGFQPVPR